MEYYPIAHGRICNGNPGLSLAVVFKAWDKSMYTTIFIIKAKAIFMFMCLLNNFFGLNDVA